jgi:hypothetical protein
MSAAASFTRTPRHKLEIHLQYGSYSTLSFVMDGLISSRMAQV